MNAMLTICNVRGVQSSRMTPVKMTSVIRALQKGRLLGELQGEDLVLEGKGTVGSWVGLEVVVGVTGQKRGWEDEALC